ncbi:bifunctional hydroxymethylpyrimidine kinase/phosphomethylpyrimidine kinase [uncultured Mailhella sp.]|uniref:bifunctional hydroxymethylpyrimidine kinase/phosphomethylpyrimidine kinase n=1 Tax=uncultured Mailhella sp. TaxID=1981031 RepID=UPI0025D6F90E|nr:bifunctional hydroxymethylpyrimidine kinase/phosphomethylpyrimidine kinase [uncultured Mailhella sp.]
MQKIPNVLTIAGSDSGGGAGIQADLKTMTMMRTFGMSVITALTAQNGLGVTGIHAPEPEFVALQLNTVLEGFPVNAAKTGMMFNSGIINAVADILDAQTFPLVVDPVCVSTSGHKLMEDEGIATLRERLMPRADLFTPNRPEAELFSGMTIKTEDDIIEAGERLLKSGARAVLMKGGHCEGNPVFVTDWLLEKGCEPVALRQPHVDTQNSHGTGCTLSAGIAAQIALGMPLRVAVTRAQEFLNLALRHSFAPGKGHGPCNHMAALMQR